MGPSGRGAHDRSRVKYNLLAICAVAAFWHHDRYDGVANLSLSGTPLPTSSMIPPPPYQARRAVDQPSAVLRACRCEPRCRSG